ncbi:MAG TPA: response regulator transcription factor [Candidatus Limnocylindrales bacterium]|nr:response regulator transcription factor [Candidatus Limnocylindrales bacterium]
MWLLIVEDENSLAAALRQGLEEENHRVLVASDGLEALHAAETCDFDAILLDVMLPGLDGIQLVRRLRSSGRQTPVLMLTARDDAADIIRGLDAGADDYLTKPFSFDVLLARLRAITRRAAQPAKSRLQTDDLLLDPASHAVWRAGAPVTLTPTEYRVLEFLMRRAGHVVSRSAIIDGVWGFEEDVEANTVDAFIRHLREKIDVGHTRKLIHTVRGYGYILREDP